MAESPFCNRFAVIHLSCWCILVRRLRAHDARNPALRSAKMRLLLCGRASIESRSVAWLRPSHNAGVMYDGPVSGGTNSSPRTTLKVRPSSCTFDWEGLWTSSGPMWSICIAQVDQMDVTNVRLRSTQEDTGMLKPEVVDRIHELSDEGLGSKRIARQLKVSREGCPPLSRWSHIRFSRTPRCTSPGTQVWCPRNPAGIFSSTCSRPLMKLTFASVELADAQELFPDGGGRLLMAGTSVALPRCLSD